MILRNRLYLEVKFLVTQNDIIQRLRTYINTTIMNTYQIRKTSESNFIQCWKRPQSNKITVFFAIYFLIIVIKLTKSFLLYLLPCIYQKISYFRKKFAKFYVFRSSDKCLYKFWIICLYHFCGPSFVFDCCTRKKGMITKKTTEMGLFDIRFILAYILLFLNNQSMACWHMFFCPKEVHRVISIHRIRIYWRIELQNFWWHLLIIIKEWS